jgi:hypothetical protein
MKIEDVFQKVYQFALIWESLGINKFTNGTTLIGKAPHIAPEAWLHTFYKGLTDVELLLLQKNIKIEFPDN